MHESPRFIRPLPDHVKLGIRSVLGGREVDQAAADTFTASVGEMGQHVAQSNVPILAVVWQISGGDPVAGYLITQALGQVLPLLPGALQENPLTFAFTTPGTWTVAVYILTEEGEGFASNTFVITAPEVNFFDSQTGQVGVFTIAGQPWLSFGIQGAPGITMNAVLFGQQSTPGEVGILQLATNQRYGTDAQGLPYHNTQNGQAVLDVGPGGAYTFYQDELVPLAVGGNAQVMVTDGPGNLLGPPLTLVSIGENEGSPEVVPESYQAFLMFCADSPGAIFVPLSVLMWNWEGFTEQQPDGSWGAVQDPGNAVNPTGTPTSFFPTWTLNTTTGGWVQG